jgi:hypothetical protein
VDEEELVLVSITALLVETELMLLTTLLELLLLTDEETGVSLYISSLLPAPQYSY